MKELIAVIGLGYVGLPLAVEFGKKRRVIGFDISHARISELEKGIDKTLEITGEELSAAAHLSFSLNIDELKLATIFIVTVPTPIDKNNHPDFNPLMRATEMIGKILKVGDLVIYESTVYPGATEEICVPILESISKLRFNQDFFCGYSPERINPGDPDRKIVNIKKITSGSTPKITVKVDDLYKEIIIAGTYSVSSIRVAEAAKVIENTQRDLNIALINELSLIFNKLGIDTEEVLLAAGTKWNFLPFWPGLVGGHCIGVDPYYLTYKAQSVGHHPEVILAGRKVNDEMGAYVAANLIKEMSRKGIATNSSKILIMGLSFKENCVDIRNTKVIDIYKELREYGCVVDIYDPLVSSEDAFSQLNISLVSSLKYDYYDAIIMAVSHRIFKEGEALKIKSYCKKMHLIYDLKYILPRSESDLRL
jgi:UDP-N-acetyl-D-galactosamine dehydrogenase